MIITLSQRFTDLKNRLDDLEINLLEGIKTKDISDLTESEQDLARAFRVLSHAEIEAYFEDSATILLNYAKEKWNTHKEVNITIAALFAHYEKIEANLPLGTKINQIVSRFQRSRIDQNHGIKEENLVKLFIPLGIDKENFDVAWLSTINSYGKDRGKTAHTAAKTQQPIDVNTELRTLEYILEGIEQLDNQIKSILQ
ncbi:hypothetical protein GN156_00030 [bacterium LRH843]|nr:hypothetical protein [bacterium LRH843]